LPGIVASDARWSPNGRWLVVVASSGTGARFTLLDTKLQVKDQIAEPRINAFRYQGQVRWTPRSDGLYFLAERPGTRASLVRIGFDPSKGKFTKTSDTLIADIRAPNGAGFDVSADGKRVVYSGGPVTRELWSLERAGARGAWKSRRLLTSTAGFTGADVSDDGLQITYGLMEPSGDKARVWVAPFDSGEAHPVTQPLSGLGSTTYPRYFGPHIKISFKDERDSLHNVLVPAAGGTPEPLPANLSYVAGLSDSGRFIEHPAKDNPLVSVFERIGRDGRVLSTIRWPDSLGFPNFKIASAVDNDVYILSQTLKAGSTTMRLTRVDPVSGQLMRLRDLSLPTTFTGMLQAQTDGRLVYGDQPGFFAGTKLRLVYFDPLTGRTESEELPLAFTELNITHDGRRVVGIVDARQSDVWMVKNFDSRYAR
jgi:hypothetical protein